jgi:hypothetical protein
MQLEKSDVERRDLLHRLLEPKQAEPPQTEKEDYQPITPQFIPWRVRQQMLETEDKKKAELMRAHALNVQRASTEQIEKLEEELGVK